MLRPSSLPEFDNHELVMPIHDKASGLRGFVAVHRGGVASLGATRLWRYRSEADAMRDALRLSRLMSYKSAIAGMKYGGAKAVLMLPPGGIKDRKLFFETYAKQVNSLKGRFVTGTDVGVMDDDVHVMRQTTPYVIGNKVDPAYYTAIGVLGGIKVAFRHVFHSDAVRGRSFAIQGVGKVGSNIVGLIYKDAKQIFVADTDHKKIIALKKKFPRVTVVSPMLIARQNVDVFVPCALSGVINHESIPHFKCKIIAGSANNQLVSGRRSKNAGAMLHKRGILYAPDYVINVGGFVAVVDEFTHGRASKQRILKKIGNMEKALATIFATAKKEDKSPDAIADRIAEKLMKR